MRDGREMRTDHERGGAESSGRRRTGIASTLAAGFACFAGLIAQSAQAQAATTVPITSGVNFVLAVSNSAASTSKGGLEGVIQGDYEMMVSLGSVGPQGVVQIAHLDGTDEKGIHRRGKVRRLVPPKDVQGARLQVLGFHQADQEVLVGTTALGPSLAITRELRENGQVTYSFRNFAALDVVSGTLTLTKPSRVKFPVLINGERTELDAIRAWGLMSARGSERPFETYILDHPTYPISLRIAYGAANAGYPFDAHFAREVVRIDFDKPSIAKSLEKECRVELVGLYFDFNLATLKPESDPALQEIAKAIGQAPTRALRIEGHTDSIGNEQYNSDLSQRRATAVKTALVQGFKVRDSLLSTAGYGESRPVESNDTLAGRARNRRVELVCAK
jgi:outer membrane protein OmpA-like peptidoglycan-associated protein